MVGKRLSFWECDFWVAMFNFGGMILNHLLIIDDPSRAVSVTEKTFFV